MPVQQRNLGDVKEQAAPVMAAYVTFEQEFEILNAAHNDVSAAKNYKIKIKIEDKKKNEATRKNYDAVIHNNVSNAVRAAAINVSQRISH